MRKILIGGCIVGIALTSSACERIPFVNRGQDPYDKGLTITYIGDTRYKGLEDMDYRKSDVTIMAETDVDGNGSIEPNEQFKFILRGYETELYEKIGKNAEAFVKDGTAAGRTPMISIDRPSQSRSVASPLQTGALSYGIRVRKVNGQDVWDISDTSLINWITIDDRKVNPSSTEKVRKGSEIKR